MNGEKETSLSEKKTIPNALDTTPMGSQPGREHLAIHL
jgi:hypothetical protein